MLIYYNIFKIKNQDFLKKILNILEKIVESKYNINKLFVPVVQLDRMAGYETHTHKLINIDIQGFQGLK